jgi:GxxExxY protein
MGHARQLPEEEALASQRSQGDPLTYAIIGAAIEVHRELGPALLESAYEKFVCFELAERGIAFRRNASLPVTYKGQRVDVGFRPDLIVNDQVIVELKCVEKLLPVHEAQILNYLRLASKRTGLLINFHAQPLITGIKRFVL